jgi:hypothetical protein
MTNSIMNKFFKTVLIISTIAISVALLQSCTKMKLIPTPKKISSICIVPNNKVEVDGMKELIYDQLAARGIKPTYIREKDDLASCNALITYTASRSFAFISFVGTAKIRLFKKSNLEMIGYVETKNNSDIENLIPVMLNKLLPENKQIDTDLSLDEAGEFEENRGSHANKPFVKSVPINKVPWGKSGFSSANVTEFSA